MNTTTLHPAYSWDCPKCGRENFTRTLRFEMTKEQANDHFQFLKRNNLTSANHFDFTILTFPKTVKCWNCGEEFQSTVLPRNIDESS